jgi:hypothetical protein
MRARLTVKIEWFNESSRTRHHSRLQHLFEAVGQVVLVEYQTLHALFIGYGVE